MPAGMPTAPRWTTKSSPRSPTPLPGTRLLRRETRLSDDVGPAACTGLLAGAELAGDEFGRNALRGQPLAQRGHGEHLRQCRGEAVQRHPGRAGGREEAIAGQVLEAGDARFGQRGHLGQEGLAARAAHRQHAQAAGLVVFDEVGHQSRAGRVLVGQHDADHRRAAAVARWHQVEPAAVMVTLRPASMAEAAGVVVLVTLSNRLWLAPTLARMLHPPQPAPVSGLAISDRLLGSVAYTNGGMTFQSFRLPVAQSIAKKTPTLTM